MVTHQPAPPAVEATPGAGDFLTPAEHLAEALNCVKAAERNLRTGEQDLAAEQLQLAGDVLQTVADAMGWGPLEAHLESLRGKLKRGPGA